MLGLLCLAPPPGWTAPKAPASVAVFPFTAQRSVEKNRWLAQFLQDELTRSLMLPARLPVLGAETAALWQRKLGLRGLDGPTAPQLQEMHVEAVLHGTSQLVLQFALIRVQITGAQGGLLPGGAASLRFDLNTARPAQLLKEVLAAAVAGLFPPGTPALPPQPERWETLWEYYALREPSSRGNAAAGLERRMARLERLTENPALVGRASVLMAEDLLKEARLRQTDGASHRKLLDAALNHARDAVTAEPWNSGALALQGEIHYFLKDDYDAKTEASIARVKNPLNGLAYAVLALAAGLSTGQANQHLQRALEVDPFLWKQNRPAGSPAFQDGVLEPLLNKWRGLRAKFAARDAGRLGPRLAAGIALFENKKWEEAEKALLEATQNDEYDHTPLLYLARIQIETGDSNAAVLQLRRLTTEFPQEAELYYYLGIALEQGEAYQEAIDAFQTSLRENPQDQRALFHIGTAAMGNGQWPRAQEALKMLLARIPGHQEGWLRYAIVNARLEQWQTAERAIGEALRLAPDAKDARQWQEKIRLRRND
ncbi:MAG: tetratricopeptide repeat protein [SAR324 cluster bacterium]|nr:tetratricopeptide repeat protein [SAR324 cluster bacterium]